MSISTYERDGMDDGKIKVTESSNISNEDGRVTCMTTTLGCHKHRLHAACFRACRSIGTPCNKLWIMYCTNRTSASPRIKGTTP